MTKVEEKGFLKGMVWALAEWNRIHDQPTVVAEIFNCAGYTIKQCERAGVDEYDLKEIKKALA
jgi:hypothetical protein